MCGTTEQSLLLTLQKYHCSHPVEIWDSNHTHFLTSFQYSLFLANSCHYRPRKELHCQKLEALHYHKTFLSPFVQRRPEIAHLVPTKSFLQLSPEASWYLGQVLRPAHSPHTTLSACTEPKSQGHCQKWYHKLKVIWCIYGSTFCNY